MIGYSDLWWLMLVEEGERFKCSPLITINSSTNHSNISLVSCICCTCVNWVEINNRLNVLKSEERRNPREKKMVTEKFPKKKVFNLEKITSFITWIKGVLY